MSILAACLLGGAAAGCSSEAPASAPVVLEPWSRAYGGAGTSSQISSITAGASGNIAVAGTFSSGPLDFGAGALETTADPNFFLAKLDSAGDHIWSGRAGGGDDFVRGIGLDRGGAAMVAGTFNGFVDFGAGGELTGMSNIFLARFGAAGDPLWARQFGADSATGNMNAMTIDNAGGVYLIGSASGDISFGLGPISQGDWAQLYVAKLNSVGGAVFSVGFSTQSYCDGRRIEVDSDGNSIVVGDFYGEVNFGGGPIAAQDGYGIFVLKLDSTGRHLWSKGFVASIGPEGQGNASSGDLAVDPEGNIILTGIFGGVLDFGGGSVDSGTSYGNIFVVKLGPDGSYRWSKSFGDASYQQLTGSATDAEGNVHLAGAFNSSIDFGGGPLVTTGQSIFLAKLDASGAHVMSKSFGDGDGSASISAFTVTTGGNPIIAGSFSGSLDFGASKLTAPENSSQMFIAALPK